MCCQKYNKHTSRMPLWSDLQLKIDSYVVWTYSLHVHLRTSYLDYFKKFWQMWAPSWMDSLSRVLEFLNWISHLPKLPFFLLHHNCQVLGKFKSSPKSQEQFVWVECLFCGSCFCFYSISLLLDLASIGRTATYHLLSALLTLHAIFSIIIKSENFAKKRETIVFSKEKMTAIMDWWTRWTVKFQVIFSLKGKDRQ